MKRVYSNPDAAMLYPIKHMLESNKIDCIIKNDKLAGVVGEVPPIECWAELWVFDEQFPEAKKLVDVAIAEPESDNTHWICPKCGEESEGQFTECWKCGTSRI